MIEVPIAVWIVILCVLSVDVQLAIFYGGLAIQKKIEQRKKAAAEKRLAELGGENNADKT